MGCREEGWEMRKLTECVEILRGKLKAEDSGDLAEQALWCEVPEVRDARGYLEAHADMRDVTVGELIDIIDGNN